jgi:hypothetical protein
MGFLRSAWLGAASGAAGTVALDITTYADMALRGRGSSDAPGTLVKKLAESFGIDALTSDDETSANRRSGVGALLGYVNGIGVGKAFGILRPSMPGVPSLLAALAVGGAAMAISDVPMVRLGVTDPKTWGTAGWLSDIIPHVVYGIVVVATFDALDALAANGGSD